MECSKNWRVYTVIKGRLAEIFIYISEVVFANVGDISDWRCLATINGIETKICIVAYLTVIIQ